VAPGAKPGASKRKEVVQLVDTKRSNNVAIALARIRLDNEQIRAAVLDPITHELAPEQVSALLSVLPTPEETETLRDYSGDKDTLGKVEQFFLCLSDIKGLGPRLQALQATQQFAPQWETLTDELKTIATAVSQVRQSKALTAILLHVLAMGNYLNGTSARGGAYGFKISDLAKLVQVKSADSKTTLLHYLARCLLASKPKLIDDLKEQLNALPEAKDTPLGEKKAEIVKLAASFQQAKTQLGACADVDALAPLLRTFCDTAQEQLTALQTESATTEEMLKDLAKWLAERPTADTSEIFGPLAGFVKELVKAAEDNARDDEAERRKQARPPANPRTGSGKFGGAKALPGMGGAMGGMGGGPGEKNVMLEMQLKLAQRTERAAEASGARNDELAQQQRQLLANAQTKLKKVGDGKADLGDELAGGAATGALFAQRRAAAARAAFEGP